MRVDAEIENVIDLFVQDRFRKAKCRNLAAHEAAAFILLVEKMEFVTKRCQVASDGQRSRARRRSARPFFRSARTALAASEA